MRYIYLVKARYTNSSFQDTAFSSIKAAEDYYDEHKDDYSIYIAEYPLFDDGE